MKTYLVKEKRFIANSVATNDEIEIEIKLTIEDDLHFLPWEAPQEDTGERAKHYTSHLKQALLSRLGTMNTSDEKYNLFAYIKIRRDVETNCHVKLHGRLLEALRSTCGTDLVLHLINHDVSRLHAKLGPKADDETSLHEEAAGGNVNESDPDSAIMWEDTHAFLSPDIHKWFFECWTTGQKGIYFSLAIESTSVITELQKETTNKVDINSRILHERFLSDVTIVANNLVEFPCHVLFLSARSSVFATMLEEGSPFEEAKTRKVKMDMAEESVKAFLEYVYCTDIHVPFLRLDIAVDLLEAGHQYDIPELEASMKTILVRASPQVMNETVALRLFLFARNVDGYEDLKSKAIAVLKSKPKALLDSKECLSLFPESVRQSLEPIVELISSMLSPD